MEPPTKRWTAILVSLLLVAAPALAQSSGSDGDQQDPYANNSTTDSSETDGADHNDTSNQNETRDGSQDDRNGTSDRDGNQTDRRESGEPDENANDVGHDARDFARDAPENAKRNVSVLVDGAQALVDMSREDEPDRDRIGLEVAADEGRMNMRLDRGGDADDAPDFQLDVQLADIVEYEDLDGDGAYTPAEDRVVSTTNVTELDWSVEAQEVAIDANTTGQQVRAAAPVGANGSVEVHVTAPGDFATIGETELTPRDVKVDYVIDGFPYATNDSRIALGVDVGAGEAYEVAQAAVGDSPAVQVANENASGYYSWKETAQVDGEAVPVNASLPDQASDNATEAVQKVYLSYGQGDEIVHDPVMGVTYESASEDVAEAPGFGVVALVAAAGVAATLAAAASRRD